MTPQLGTGTIAVSKRPSNFEVTSSVRWTTPIERVTPSEAMGRMISEPMAPLALERAHTIFSPLRRELERYAWHTNVTRIGEAVLTFINGRKYAVLTADNDGDLILTLTDRASNDEADAEVMLGDIALLASRIGKFLAQ